MDYEQWIAEANLRKDPEVERFIRSLKQPLWKRYGNGIPALEQKLKATFKRVRRLEALDRKKRQAVAQKLATAWGKCSIEIQRIPDMLTDKRTRLFPSWMYLKEYGFGLFYLVDQKGKRHQVNGDWLNAFLTYFPEKRLEEVFKSVRYSF